MTSTIGTLDRAARVATGLVLLSLPIIRPRTLWGFAGFISLLTGLAGFCPACRIAGVGTCAACLLRANIDRCCSRSST